MSDEPVGVLDGSSFPGMVWPGEVEENACGFLYSFVAMKFTPIVCGDGFDSVFGNKGNQNPVHLFGRFVVQLADHCETHFSVYQGQDAMLGDFAEHQVEFEVAIGEPLFGLHRTHRKGALSGQFSPAIL